MFATTVSWQDKIWHFFVWMWLRTDPTNTRHELNSTGGVIVRQRSAGALFTTCAFVGQTKRWCTAHRKCLKQRGVFQGPGLLICSNVSWQQDAPNQCLSVDANPWAKKNTFFSLCIANIKWTYIHIQCKDECLCTRLPVKILAFPPVLQTRGTWTRQLHKSCFMTLCTVAEGWVHMANGENKIKVALERANQERTKDSKGLLFKIIWAYLGRRYSFYSAHRPAPALRLHVIVNLAFNLCISDGSMGGGVCKDWIKESTWEQALRRCADCCCVFLFANF